MIPEKKIPTYDMFPSNLNKFSCTGPDCIDNCCYKWDINVEKEYFETQKEKNPELYEDMMENTIIKKSSVELAVQETILAKLREVNLEKYVEKALDKDKDKDKGRIIKLNDQNRCSFCDEDMLCKLHKEYGAENLPAICRIYPRVTFNCFEKELYSSLQLSCSEACNLFFSNKEMMSFSISNNKGFVFAKDNPEEYCNLRVKNTFNTILLKKNINIFDKLKIICIMFSKLEPFEVVDENNFNDFEEVLEFFLDEKTLANYVESLSVIKINMTFRKELDSILRVMMETLKFDKLMKKDNFYSKFFEDLENAEGFSEFELNRDKTYKKLMTDYYQLIENYIIMMFINESFPSKMGSYNQAFKHIVYRVNISICFLMYFFRNKKFLTEVDICFAISYFEKYFGNRQNKIDYDKDFFKAYENLNLATAISLLNIVEEQ